MILGENKFFLKRNIFLAVLLAFNLFFMTGCPRPAMRTSKTYFAPPSLQGTQGFYHTLQKGETLYHISKLYNVDLKKVTRANNIKDPSSLEVGQKLFIPQARTFDPSPSWKTGSGPVSFEDALRLVGPRCLTSNWKTITVHHSGTLQGSARNFDRDHKRRKMGGLFYHFVIGNGTASRDGEVEVGFRWQCQIKANRPNDVQLCLVGNFDQQDVSEAQFNTLVNMIRALQQVYNIPTSRVRSHRNIPGKHTDCPGKRFPFGRLISSL